MYVVIAFGSALVEMTPTASVAIAALDGLRYGVMYRRDTFGRLIPVGMRVNGQVRHGGNAL